MEGVLLESWWEIVGEVLKMLWVGGWAVVVVGELGGKGWGSSGGAVLERGGGCFLPKSRR